MATPGGGTETMGYQYTSFSGVDIKAMVDGNIVGSMQAISYAVQREKAPIYTMGNVDPLSFSRGKRGIAGTIISLLLDQHLVRQGVFKKTTFIQDKDELIPGALSSPLQIQQVDVPTAHGVSQTPRNIDDIWGPADAGYVDQLMPFDVTIIAANEYGKSSSMRIYGCEILNEGSGFSIDDIVIESQMTYVCRVIRPWQRLAEWTQNSSGNFETNSRGAPS